VDPIRWIAEVALAISVLASAVAVFAGVIFRYVLNDPSSWLDEFAVLAFAWMTMVGAAVVQKNDAHLQIDSFVKPLPARLQAVAYTFRFFAIAITLVVLIWQGWIITNRMAFVEYPAMGISRAFLLSTLPVCMPVVMYYLIRVGIADLRRIRRGEKVFEKPAAIDLL
jgi:TRAP-type C4-dicarboxylate transport system permease small subunit